jgi:plasmid replication initiation protein
MSDTPNPQSEPESSLEALTGLQQINRIEEHYRVSKSNILVDSVYSLTANEQKLLLCIMSLISPDDEEFKTYRVTVSALKEVLGITGNSFHQELKDMTFNILKKPFVYRKEGKAPLQGTWFATCQYFENEGVAEFEFSPKVRTLLLKLKRDFTTYTLVNIIQLKSKYSIRLYELLKKSQGFRNPVIYQIEDLRELLGVEDQYPMYGNFKARVLDPAKKEISEQTDISVTFSAIKQGRKTGAVRFTIKSKKTAQREDEIDLF